ncbi:MAG: VanZ family protein [Rubricoccaceae bacterium]|nr:VanZ family protein [Rubricoccaceae bacterium]
MTLAVVAAIYATLGLSSLLAGASYDEGLSAAAFLGLMLLIGVTILTQGLKVRPAGREIGVGIGIAVVYFFMFFRMTMPERSHLIEYSVVAVLIYEALTERAGQGRNVPFPALLAILATSLIGALDEGVQLFLPSRVFDPLDIVFNSLAALIAVVAMAILGWARRRNAPP